MRQENATYKIIWAQSICIKGLTFFPFLFISSAIKISTSKSWNFCRLYYISYIPTKWYYCERRWCKVNVFWTDNRHGWSQYILVTTSTESTKKQLSYFRHSLVLSGITKKNNMSVLFTFVHRTCLKSFVHYKTILPIYSPNGVSFDVNNALYTAYTCTKT